MKKQKILKKLEDAGVIAVVRGRSKEEAIKASQALVTGGVVGLEVTFTVPNAVQVIETLSAQYQGDEKVVVGAGTVLDAVTARLAIMAGAEFVVSPTFDLETAEICNLYQMPYLPGCMTITEMKVALKAGADIIKLFPGSAYGPSIISGFKAPMPQLNIMPTGGVSLENMAEWFRAGVVAVGVGGNLLAPATKGDFEGVTAIAKQYAEKYAEIKNQSVGVS
ncbi:bifunctional 2-keto-4-hydroxyglutarate aldolase/2-keto-3-deoxy-6-phosphogluconate aldolase [Lactococcus laudensis]|uniref:Bifunctional 2-keto-4-hydroxyglutarate aldolase/2-keto-3-deoxy-6-phosphogluconate aldolase n=1 Tax=Pseudolactococcus laudensis TaxID=1494461 RepID=A0A7V8SJU7_9LACT|nr:bifunctional 2-keto-4-hydroxyglutarate aldolase/2-keto-3-deoxy-6-phosphogluconate aldolase [Lactococcus laudensis]MBA0016666.1 bifunctional 2-keto-4-hydroxyglutarate aldolase/2-keto-3-deoxy-6-phosphogluconate aldolase [Lactococcus laudensis]MBQ6144459.1 bifunctional 2-keto-4-hydroxyglutarate aldolase/2-keto-3-deoxy-6-phosphogluconate aldolase [Lactococcus sp.]MBR2762781.1 bifunctional 2-keto-4-hydroxyglutarate aldolase/2-keto-3-deoxy-6-phosphogluconate aldolase [Lactococcus sp.]MBW9281370.1 